jgi:hypothetical protein
MSQTIGFTRKVLFRLRWVVMSPERRYACLWARTKRSLSQTGANAGSAHE